MNRVRQYRNARSSQKETAKTAAFVDLVFEIRVDRPNKRIMTAEQLGSVSSGVNRVRTDIRPASRFSFDFPKRSGQLYISDSRRRPGWPSVSLD